MGEKSKARQRVRGRKRESPIHSTGRWVIFLFLPFISVKAHTEQKAANADETNQPDHVVSALLFGEAEDKQWDLNKQVVQWFYSVTSNFISRMFKIKIKFIFQLINII